MARLAMFAAVLALLVGCGASSLALDSPMHFKSGASTRLGNATVTLRMLPKLMLAGPEPEVEQVQIEVTRGADHAVLQVDTRHKSAEWAEYVFVLGYADVYRDDIELTVHKR